jgi:hypothetical protein
MRGAGCIWNAGTAQPGLRPRSQAVKPGAIRYHLRPPALNHASPPARPALWGAAGGGVGVDRPLRGRLKPRPSPSAGRQTSRPSRTALRGGPPLRGSPYQSGLQRSLLSRPPPARMRPIQDLHAPTPGITQKFPSGVGETGEANSGKQDSGPKFMVSWLHAPTLCLGFPSPISAPRWRGGLFTRETKSNLLISRDATPIEFGMHAHYTGVLISKALLRYQPQMVIWATAPRDANALKFT